MSIAIPPRPESSSRIKMTNEELFGTAAWAFEKRSFRLETRSNYDVDEDDALFKSYSNGLPMPEPDQAWRDWFTRLKSEAYSGKEFVRVHLVPAKLTKYLEYEIRWAYVNWNSKCGEKVYLLEREENPDIANLSLGDFFLFDDTRLALINYTKDDRWAGNQWERDTATIAWHREVAKIILQRAMPLVNYLARQ